MAVNVAKIFENTIKPGKSYCRICLRTAEETTLINPRNLLLFTDVLKLNVFDNNKKDTACYVCEATAATALKMYQACVNAVSIRNVCNPLKTMRANHSVPDWLRSAILVCNANLKDFRQRTTLQQTEVLVVDSAGVEWQPDKTSDPILVLAPNVTATEEQQPIETVVLDDDDDPSLSTNRKLVPIEQMLDPKTKDRSVAALLPNQMQIISRHNEEENNFILHPVIVGPDGKMLAPSLSSYVKDNALVYDPELFQKLPLIDCTNKNDITCVIENPQELAQNCSNALLINETVEVEEKVPERKRRVRPYGAEKLGSLRNSNSDSLLKDYLEDSKKNSKKKRTSNDLIKDNAKKRTEGDDRQYIVDLNMVNDILDSKSEGDPIAVITNVISTSASGTESGISEVPPRPVGLVEKGCKIDWEDKIPMDVISFIDATDPNERELIVPDPLVIHQPTQTAEAESQTAPPRRASPTNAAARKYNTRHNRTKSQINESTVIDLC